LHHSAHQRVSRCCFRMRLNTRSLYAPRHNDISRAARNRALKQRIRGMHRARPGLNQTDNQHRRSRFAGSNVVVIRKARTLIYAPSSSMIPLKLIDVRLHIFRYRLEALARYPLCTSGARCVVQRKSRIGPPPRIDLATSSPSSHIQR